MTRIPEVQLFPIGCATPARLCASDDEALIDAFVRLLREAIQHQVFNSRRGAEARRRRL